MAKTIEVVIVRRVATWYQYEVDDDFDVSDHGARQAVESDYFDGKFGSEDEVVEEVWNFEVDDVKEV